MLIRHLPLAMMDWSVMIRQIQYVFRILYRHHPQMLNQLERLTTYTDVKINGGTNVYHASPGQSLTLTGSWSEEFINPGCCLLSRVVSRSFVLAWLMSQEKMYLQIVLM